MPGVPSEPAAAPTNTKSAAMDEFMLPTEEDLLYEEELLRNPYSLKMWTRYIDAREGVAERRRHVLFERALKALPGSYKVRPSWIYSSAHSRRVGRCLS
jgi:pre-mRNA-splicing factor SYF1